MGVLAVLSLLLCLIHMKDAASLKYLYSAVSPGLELPEFTAVGTVDDEQFMYYDSKIRKMIPKTEWIKESEGADYWATEIRILNNQWEFFSTSLRIIMEHFNQTEGVHTLQNMFGCEWDNESGATERFDHYGYDREDFVILDNKSWSFVALVPEAEFLIQKWDYASDQLEHRKQFLTQECVERLMKYVRYGNSSLERTVPPQVSLLQKDPSSPVTCHVTGFYPRGVMVTWQKNGQDLDEGFELEKTVPNGDGTFQTRSHLRVNPEEWKRDRYTCTVQHKSLEQDIILTVAEGNIRRNVGNTSETKAYVNPDGSSSSTGMIIGCVVGALLTLAAISVFIWKKRSSVCDTCQRLQADFEDSDRESAEEPTASGTDPAISSPAESASLASSCTGSEDSGTALMGVQLAQSTENKSGEATASNLQSTKPSMFSKGRLRRSSLSL